MLHRFFETIREMGYASGFETYYRNLLRNGLPGAPTADEARKEYHDIARLMSEYSAF